MPDHSKSKQKPEAPQTTPEGYPTAPPQQAFPSGDFSYILEIVMNMQTSMGKLIEAVDSLKAQSTKDGEKLNRISHIIYAAGAVGTIFVVIIGFLANKAADAFIASLKATGH